MGEEVKKSRIAVIDDAQDLVNMIKLRLEKSGFEVLCAYDGLSEIELIKKENPDLVILGLNK